MAPRDDAEIVREFLDAQSTLTLAVADADGPWAAAVYFVRLGRELYFFSSPRSRHARAFERDPASAGAVSAPGESYEDIRGVQLAGRVEPVTDPVRRARVLAAYLRKFPFVRGLLEAGPAAIGGLADRVRFYRLSPGRVLFVDNSRGLGSRTEVDW